MYFFSNNGSNSVAQFTNNDAGMPTGPVAEMEEKLLYSINNICFHIRHY